MGAADTDVRTSALRGEVVLALSRDGREELRQPRAGLSLPQRKLLTLIDGKRSLRQIAADEPTLHGDRLASDAARLLGRGLVEIEQGHLEPITRSTTLPPRIAPAAATASPPRMVPDGATTTAPRTSAARTNEARTNEAPPAPRTPAARVQSPQRKVATWLVAAAVGAVGVATGYLLQPSANTTGAVPPPSRVIAIAPAPAAAEANETAGRTAVPAAGPAAATTVAAAPALPRSERELPAAAPVPRSVSVAPQAERPASPSQTAAPAPRNVLAAAPPTERATSLSASTAPAPMRGESEPPAAVPAVAARSSTIVPPPVEQASSSTTGTNTARPAGPAAPAAEAAASARVPALVAAVEAPAANGASAEVPARPEAVVSRPPVVSTPAAEAAQQGLEKRSAETAASAPPPLAAIAPAPSRSEPATPAEAAVRPTQPDVPVWAREFAPLAPESDSARSADAGGRLAPIERIPPAYPRDAVMAGISRGSIRARAHLAADGRVERVELQPVDSNSRYFERSARAALMTWLFPPGERGRIYEVTLNFVAP